MNCSMIKAHHTIFLTFFVALEKMEWIQTNGMKS